VSIIGPIFLQSEIQILGTKRTPIREAIQRLAREHLIVILSQRGLLVP
jgi:DNA-binding GntR family transcriptional regulator